MLLDLVRQKGLEPPRACAHKNLNHTPTANRRSSGTDASLRAAPRAAGSPSRPRLRARVRRGRRKANSARRTFFREIESGRVRFL